VGCIAIYIISLQLLAGSGTEKQLNFHNEGYMEQAVEFMLGITFTILGLSYVVRTSAWISWLEHLKGEHRRGSLPIGIACLLTGTFIVSFHWVWEGLPLLTTAIGVLCIIKGAIYLLFPQWLPIKIKILENNFTPILRVSGILVMIIGLIVLNNWSCNAGIERFKEFENILFNVGSM
jgi:uncharacterized protein YjeT (DUF2065 family)